MSTFLVVLHVLVCFFLIAVVLLQRGKGAEIGAVFGSGASSTVFGSRGAGNFLTKLTTISAVIFMLTSLSLSYLWTTSSSDRLFDDPVAEEEAPAPAEELLFEEVETVPAQPDSGSGIPALPEPAAGAETE
jgi:preprotein translocase subunit SecG